MNDLKYDLRTGKLSSKQEKIEEISRNIGETLELYENPLISEELKKQVAYYVQVHNPFDGQEGALQFGTSNIEPGNINGEFIMTKGHTHEITNRAEYYFGIQGRGLLLLMDENRNTKIEEVNPNSLHYIPGNTAHRLVNIGETRLVVGACWNADAGHNYDLISKNGFSVRIFQSDNEQGYKIVPNKHQGEK